MNRIRLLTFVLTIVVLAGCDKKDPKPSSELVGKWNLKTTDTNITVPDGDLRHYLISQLAMLPEDADSYVVYLESGEASTIDITSIEFNNNGSYRATGETGLEGQWFLTAGNIALVFDRDTDHEMRVVVQELNENELILEFDLTEQVGLPNLDYKVVMSFEKQ